MSNSVQSLYFASGGSLTGEARLSSTSASAAPQLSADPTALGCGFSLRLLSVRNQCMSRQSWRILQCM
jgi:hypothetical protein